jgi:hypothetical protein
MVLKLELLLVFLIVIMLSIAYSVKLSDTIPPKKTSRKEMEFTHTTLTEVNTEKLLSTSTGSYGVRKDGILTIKALVYHTDSIERLLSDSGRYVGENVYLDGHIRLKQKKGFSYQAEHAVYHKKTEVLEITSKFIAKMNQNIVHGNSAQYDTRKKILSAQKIHAVVYTAEK